MGLESQFTQRTKSLEPVEIREVIDMIQGRETIPLAAGWPSPESFPVDHLEELISDAFREDGREMLQYGSTRGLPRLRDAIAERLSNQMDMAVTADEVLVTAGSQQGLYLLSRAFVDDATDVVVGAPTYVAALTAFRTYLDPAFHSVPLDDAGLDVDQLDRLAREENIDVLYTVPTFQNPSGVTMTEDRREQIVELAREHDVLIVEDQPYEELRFAGNAVPSIYSMAPERTVYLGTFSKILAPGFRLGWIVADEAVIRKLELIKQPVDLQSNNFGQHVAARYLNSGVIDEQVAKIQTLYRERRDVAVTALENSMPSDVVWTEPDGGMFLWLTLSEGVDTKEMLPMAVDEGVAYIPGGPFYATDPKLNTLRLNYTFVGPDALETGIERLATTIEQY